MISDCLLNGDDWREGLSMAARPNGRPHAEPPQLIIFFPDSDEEDSPESPPAPPVKPRNWRIVYIALVFFFGSITLGVDAVFTHPPRRLVAELLGAVLSCLLALGFEYMLRKHSKSGGRNETS